MPKTVPLAQYIFTRLRQLGCHSIHGVPGDYTLRALDYIQTSGVKWIGNANELCAGYAADGYARAGFHRSARLNTGPKVGALFTTYGVGELSAINAVAGSYSESVPVVHLVGTPSRKNWAQRSDTRLLHHTLADSRREVYADMARQVTCSQVLMHLYQNVEDAAQAYDQCLLDAIAKSKPVYVGVPADMGEMPVPVDLLDTELTLERASTSAREIIQVAEKFLEKIGTARHPLLIADALVYPFDLIQEANDLARLAHLPTAYFTAGKGVLDETAPGFRGALTGPSEQSAQTDLTLIFGPLLSNTNTAAWTAIPPTTNTVLFNLDTIEIDGVSHKVQNRQVLQEVIRRLQQNPQRFTKHQTSSSPSQQPQQPSPRSTDGITQDALWSTLAPHIASNDTLLFANGTPLIGSRDMALPPGNSTQVISSGIWCSIGSMLPAAQGVALAKRDHKIPGRTILYEGDGSLQVTAQSLSDIIRQRLDVTIFLVNNSGYTYERWLNGMHASYNDVGNWEYTLAPRFFGAPEGGWQEYPISTRKVVTMGELQVCLPDVVGGKGLKIVEVVVGREDVPARARKGLERASKVLRGEE